MIIVVKSELPVSGEFQGIPNKVSPDKGLLLVFTCGLLSPRGGSRESNRSELGEPHRPGRFSLRLPQR